MTRPPMPSPPPSPATLFTGPSPETSTEQGRRAIQSFLEQSITYIDTQRAFQDRLRDWYVAEYRRWGGTWEGIK